MKFDFKHQILDIYSNLNWFAFKVGIKQFPQPQGTSYYK